MLLQWALDSDLTGQMHPPTPAALCSTLIHTSSFTLLECLLRRFNGISVLLLACLFKPWALHSMEASLVATVHFPSPSLHQWGLNDRGHLFRREEVLSVGFWIHQWELVLKEMYLTSLNVFLFSFVCAGVSSWMTTKQSKVETRGKLLFFFPHFLLSFIWHSRYMY